MATEVIPTEQSERRLNEHEAAAILQVSVHTIRDWRKRKRGPRYRKLNNSIVRYSLPDLIEFWNQSPAGGGQPEARP